MKLVKDTDQLTKKKEKSMQTTYLKDYKEKKDCLKEIVIEW